MRAGEDPEEKGDVGVVSTQLARTLAIAVSLVVVITLVGVWLYRNSVAQVKECSLLNFYASGVINLILHVSLFSLFVCVFFFTIVHVVEKRTVFTNIRRVVYDLIDEIYAGYGKPVHTTAIISSINAMTQTPQMQREDADVKASNAALWRKAIKIFGGILVLGVLFSALVCGGMYAYARRKDPAPQAGCDYPHIGNILKHNAIVLFFVLITEVFSSTASP